MKYTGGCHCGEVRFEVDLELDSVVACNCSICSKKGHLLAFASEESFRLLQGEGALSDYQFGSKKIHHLFCSKCGIGSFGRGTTPDGKAMRAINTRCLDNVDFESLSIQKVNGKDF